MEEVLELTWVDVTVEFDGTVDEPVAPTGVVEEPVALIGTVEEPVALTGSTGVVEEPVAVELSSSGQTVVETGITTVIVVGDSVRGQLVMLDGHSETVTAVVEKIVEVV